MLVEPKSGASTGRRISTRMTAFEVEGGSEKDIGVSYVTVRALHVLCYFNFLAVPSGVGTNPGNVTHSPRRISLPDACLLYLDSLGALVLSIIIKCK